MKISSYSLYCLLILIIVGCGSKKSTDNSNITYPIVSIVARDTTITSEYVADIHAIRNVEIRARVSGFLENIFIDEGQKVIKGQTLFKINAEEYKILVASATASLNASIAEAKSAELEVGRLKMLVEKKVISKTDLEVANSKLLAATSKVDEAKSLLSNANLRLAYTNIKAPFHGLVDRIPLKTGSLISEGSLLTTLSDITEMYCYFNVSEREYLTYIKSKDKTTDNMSVQLILADGSTYPYSGKIETVEREIDSETGSIAFRAKFPNPERILAHGASGKIVVKHKVNNALLIPQRCTFEIQDKNFVFIVDSTNTIKMKSFIPQTRLEDFYVVQSGLKTGDRIIYEGIQNIQEGTKIIPQIIIMDSLMKDSEL